MSLRAGRIRCTPALHPKPGQYLVASSPNRANPLPVTLFAAGEAGDELLIAPSLPEPWTVGTLLNIRGALGNGFRLPVTARRVALACFEDTPERLMSLATLALEQGAAVALYTPVIPAGLPAEVEVLPLEQAYEAAQWADYLALEFALPRLGAIRATLRLKVYEPVGCTAQALILVPMPCAHNGECGVCSVSTRAGWKFACVDGPVFDFNTLEAG